MKLTKKKAIELFRAHWKWLSETGKEEKDEWPEFDFWSELIENECFLCEFTWGKIPGVNGKDVNCLKCPIDWGIAAFEYDSCPCESAAYKKWRIAKTKRTRKKYAKIISELQET